MRERIFQSQQLTRNRPQETARLLHFDHTENDLRLWAWYVEVIRFSQVTISLIVLLETTRPCYPDGKRVPPKEINQYKLDYYFRAPCCLCAYSDDTLRYSEAKIGLLESVNHTPHGQEVRPFIGQYVAECAREDSCGYFGEY